MESRDGVRIAGREEGGDGSGNRGERDLRGEEESEFFEVFERQLTPRMKDTPNEAGRGGGNQSSRRTGNPQSSSTFSVMVFAITPSAFEARIVDHPLVGIGVSVRLDEDGSAHGGDHHVRSRKVRQSSQ